MPEKAVGDSGPRDRNSQTKPIEFARKIREPNGDLLFQTRARQQQLRCPVIKDPQSTDSPQQQIAGKRSGSGKRSLAKERTGYVGKQASGGLALEDESGVSLDK